MSIGSDTGWHWHYAVYCRHWCLTVNQCSSYIYLLFFIAVRLQTSGQVNRPFWNPAGSGSIFIDSLLISFYKSFILETWLAGSRILLLLESTHFEDLAGRTSICIDFLLDSYQKPAILGTCLAGVVHRMPLYQY